MILSPQRDPPVAERYLTAWHSRHANATRVFGEMRDDAGRTSFDRLTEPVTSDRIVLDLACGAGELLTRLPAAASPTPGLALIFARPS